MDPSVRHRLFIASMIVIELHDTRLVECLQNLLGNPPLDQPHFLDVNVLGFVLEVPLNTDSPGVS